MPDDKDLAGYMEAEECRECGSIEPIAELEDGLCPQCAAEELLWLRVLQHAGVEDDDEA